MSLKPLTVLYKEANGSKITTDIYLPASEKQKQKYPVGESESTFITPFKY
jgi:hypothetical protein